MARNRSAMQFGERGLAAVAAKRLEEDHRYLLELIRVLRRHPAGLRRWSIMRTIRKNREAAGLPIRQRMEDAVERVFRSHCAHLEHSKNAHRAPETALFHWPKGKGGGIWAVHADRAEAWLEADGADIQLKPKCAPRLERHDGEGQANTSSVNL